MATLAAFAANKSGGDLLAQHKRESSSGHRGALLVSWAHEASPHPPRRGGSARCRGGRRLCLPRGAHRSLDRTQLGREPLVRARRGCGVRRPGMEGRSAACRALPHERRKSAFREIGGIGIADSPRLEAPDGTLARICQHRGRRSGPGLAIRGEAGGAGRRRRLKAASTPFDGPCHRAFFFQPARGPGLVHEGYGITRQTGCGRVVAHHSRRICGASRPCEFATRKTFGPAAWKLMARRLFRAQRWPRRRGRRLRDP